MLLLPTSSTKMHSSKEYTMGYFYTDAALFHADKRDKGMNSTTSEKGTDNKRNNSSAYNHEYYMKNKEKWQDNKKSGDAKFAEYQKGDSDFDDANYSEKNRLGDTDFFGFQKPDGSWVILEEDMKWTLPAGMDRAEMIKALEAFDKEMEAKRGNYTSKDWQEAANKAINSASKKKSSDSGEKEFDVDAAAMDVIRGKYGNGAERKAALGEDYAEVQKRVNELMKAQNDKTSTTSKEKNKTDSSSKETKEKKYVRHMEVDMTNNDWRIYQGDLDYLAHHGIKGQKWGVRRFENPDGTLTAAGRKRYGEESDLSKNVKSARNEKRTASREYDKSFSKAYRKSSNLLNHLTKKGRQAQDEAWDDAYDKADKYKAKKQEYKDAKNAYKDEYKKNLKEARDKATLKDKFMYNDATRRKAAKLMTKYKDMSFEDAKKESQRIANRNTAIVLGAYGAMAAVAIGSEVYSRNKS